MSYSSNSSSTSCARIYQIRVHGHMGPQWSSWFQGMEIVWEADGHTLIHGEIVDQSALHGLLRKIRDLSMPLVSIHSFQTKSDSDHIFQSL